MSYMETIGSRRAAGEELYGDGRTKQAFKDETDINKLLARAARGESLSHLVKYGGVYSDFSDMEDLLSAHAKLERGRRIFADLPGEVRREFSNDPAAFFKFVNDPANAGDLARVLPQLARPGDQLPNVARTGPRGAPPPEPAVSPPPSAEPAPE